MNACLPLAIQQHNQTWQALQLAGTAAAARSQLAGTAAATWSQLQQPACSLQEQPQEPALNLIHNTGMLLHTHELMLACLPGSCQHMGPAANHMPEAHPLARHWKLLAACVCVQIQQPQSMAVIF